MLAGNTTHNIDVLAGNASTDECVKAAAAYASESAAENSFLASSGIYTCKLKF